MNAIDLHMIISVFEGPPNSVRESMCRNTPVVSTSVGNVPEMIGDIPRTYVTKSFEAKELAECVDKILKSEKTFEGRDLFLSKGYIMANVEVKLKEIYTSIM